MNADEPAPRAAEGAAFAEDRLADPAQGRSMIQMNQNSQGAPAPCRVRIAFQAFHWNQHPARLEMDLMASNASVRRSAESFATAVNRLKLKDRIISGERKEAKYCRASAGSFRSRSILVIWALLSPSSRESYD